jgi:hypothetical protein
VGFALGAGYRTSAADAPPSVGLSMTTLIGHRYAWLADRFGLGVTASFAFERYAREVSGVKETSPGKMEPFQGTRELQLLDFVALQTATVALGRVHPWVAAGAGLGVARFASPEPRYAPGESRRNMALLQAAAGVAVNVSGPTDVELRIEHTRPLWAPAFDTEAGERLRLFGNRLSVRLGIEYRF